METEGDRPEGEPEPPDMWRVARWINIIAAGLILAWLALVVVSKLMGH